MTESKRKDVSRREKIDWIRLIRSENVGPITFYKLLDRFGTATDALAALPDLAKRGGKRSIKICPIGAAEREMEAWEAIGARVVVRGENDYPPVLAHIDDAPPVLSLRGHGHILRKRSMAVVGSRNASVNGQRFAERLARDLGAAGLLIVSGMARGIDTAAHVGALETGTVAVLAGGVDVVYPKENAGLYEKIIEQGVAVSEMPPGTVPQARHFPRRNRIISGISRGAVIIEANARSGALITARMALEQGREVFAVPGWPSDPRSAGANQMIRQGAMLIRSAEDVLESLDDLFRNHVGEQKPVDFDDKIPDSPEESEVDAARNIVIDGLGPTPVGIDELIRQCHFSPAVVHTILLELELAGRLERHPGNAVSRID